MVLIGAGFIAVTLMANLFNVGPAFDKLTDDFRPIMNQDALQVAQQDIDSLAAAGTEIQNKMLPALAQQLGMTPDQLSSMMADQYPDVTAGLTALPQITPTFTGLVTTLDQNRPYFEAADAIPTESIPASSVSWSLLAVGIVVIALGVWVWFKPRAGSIVALVLGAALIAVPVILDMPHKADYADTLNENLKPVYTQELIDQANASLATLSAMGTEMQTKMLPDLAAQMNMTPEELNAFVGQNFPDTSAALAGMQASMGRFQGMVTAFANNLDNYETLKPVSFVPIVWYIIGSGIALVVLGAAGAVMPTRKTERSTSTA
jgi:hypothetical protein